MRRRLLIAFVLGGTGCTLFLDTDGFGEDPAPIPDGGEGGSDAPIATADTGAPGDTSTPIDSGASPDAADAAVGPIGDWPFDEGTGSVVIDHSGRSHNGTISGGVWGSDHVDIPGQAIAFDGGPSNFVSISGHPDFDRAATASFTMFAWARFDEAPDHDLFFSVSYGASNSAFGVELMNATTLTYFDSKDHVGQATIPSVVGAWHHFGVVVEGSQARIYFDGVRVSQGVADTTTRTATQVFLGHSSWGNYLRGAVDKARFFRLALTDAEMMAEKNR